MKSGWWITPMGVVGVVVWALIGASVARADVSRDKKLHFIGGGVIALAARAVTDDAGERIAIVAAIAAAKELHDAQHRSRHTPDVNDFAATVLGGLTAEIAIGAVSRPAHVMPEYRDELRRGSIATKFN